MNASARVRKAIPEYRVLCRRWNSTSPTKYSPNVVFSGIQPTGVPHLGNYLGALQQWKKLQDQGHAGFKTIFSVVDLHAITLRQSADQLRVWRREMLASLLAIGLDPAKSIIFIQSQVSAHSELMWILTCFASVGYLSRMTQWKSKLNLSEDARIGDKHDKPLPLGLFSYPVLQAADVLLYQTTHVPVGEDQSQHLEFVRNCAESFNHLYGRIFEEPATLICEHPIELWRSSSKPLTFNVLGGAAPAKRVMSLTNPRKKMSKSDANAKSRITIIDTEDVIRKKVNAAVTDSEDGISYDPVARPGIANLLQIASNLYAGQGLTPDAMAADFRSSSKKAFKTEIAARIDCHLAPIRQRYAEFHNRDDGRYLAEIAEEGAMKASTIANNTLSKVKEAVGLQ